MPPICDKLRVFGEAGGGVHIVFKWNLSLSRCWFGSACSLSISNPHSSAPGAGPGARKPETPRRCGRWSREGSGKEVACALRHCSSGKQILAFQGLWPSCPASR